MINYTKPCEAPREQITLKMNGWQQQSQNQSQNLRRECSRRKCFFIHYHT
ncbi:DDIT3 upstream open reading frame protein-like [Dugong dugon]